MENVKIKVKIVSRTTMIYNDKYVTLLCKIVKIVNCTNDYSKRGFKIQHRNIF